MIVIYICDDLPDFTLNNKYYVNRLVQSKVTDVLYYEILNDINILVFEYPKNFKSLKEYRSNKISKLINML